MYCATEDVWFNCNNKGVFTLKTAKKNLRASQNHSFQRNHNVTEPFHHPAHGTVGHKIYTVLL